MGFFKKAFKAAVGAATFGMGASLLNGGNKANKDFVFLCVDKETKDIGIYNVSEEFYYEGERLVDNAVSVFNTWFSDEPKNIDQYTITGTL